MARMRRTQVYLEPELVASLDRLARERGTSRAALIRAAAQTLVKQQTSSYGSILELVGMGRGDAADVSERHDDYLAEFEFAKWKR
jgi:hypothetical protein